MRYRTEVVSFVFALLMAMPCLAQDLSLPGPFLAGWRSVTVVRPNNSTFTARLYYPGSTAGQNAGLNAAGAPFPAISFGHGFLQPVDRYQSTLEHLATWGLVVIASDSEGGLFPSHTNFALDMRQCLTYLEQQNALAGSFLQGAIATSRFGMSGHSMGGGCSILAAAADPRIRALANLAAAETNPSAISQMANLTIPVDLICGSSDTIVPVSGNGQLMYNAGRAPKMLQVIQGGFHCGFEDVSTFGCDSGPLIRTDQLAITRRLLTAWFALYLRSDQTIWSAVWGPARNADLRVTSAAEPGAALLPNPVEMTGFQYATATATLTLTNTSPFVDSFTLSAEGATWATSFIPAESPSLPPGGVTTVQIRVAIPAGVSPATQPLLATTRSVRDGGTRAYTSVNVRRWCYADLDQSGNTNANDFLAFLNAYAAQNPLADADGSGALNANDFSAFLNAFAAGCGR